MTDCPPNRAADQLLPRSTPVTVPATVMARDGDWLQVVPQATSACRGCTNRRRCGLGALGAHLGARPLWIRWPQTGSGALDVPRAGDETLAPSEVTLSVSEARFLAAAVLAYLVPIVGALGVVSFLETLSIGALPLAAAGIGSVLAGLAIGHRLGQHDVADLGVRLAWSTDDRDAPPARRCRSVAHGLAPTQGLPCLPARTCQRAHRPRATPPDCRRLSSMTRPCVMANSLLGSRLASRRSCGLHSV